MASILCRSTALICGYTLLLWPPVTAWLWITALPSFSRHQLGCNSWHQVSVEGRKVLKDSTDGGMVDSNNVNSQNNYCLSCRNSFLLLFCSENRWTNWYFPHQLTVILLWLKYKKTVQHSFESSALFAGEVFTVCQQWCLAVVALRLHKCSVWWSKLVEVTADSNERLTDWKNPSAAEHT